MKVFKTMTHAALINLVFLLMILLVSTGFCVKVTSKIESETLTLNLFLSKDDFENVCSKLKYIQGIRLKIAYSLDVLELKNVTQTNLTGDWEAIRIGKDKQTIVLATSYVDKAFKCGEGKFLELKFKILKETLPYEVSFEYLEFSDPNGTIITLPGFSYVVPEEYSKLEKELAEKLSKAKQSDYFDIIILLHENTTSKEINNFLKFIRDLKNRGDVEKVDESLAYTLKAIPCRATKRAILDIAGKDIVEKIELERIVEAVESERSPENKSYTSSHVKKEKTKEETEVKSSLNFIVFPCILIILAILAFVFFIKKKRI